MLFKNVRAFMCIWPSIGIRNEENINKVWSARY
jgi:hypothetical protein